MRRRLQLDGLDPRTLVELVREMYGPDARVVKAERVTTGRWWGRGEREHYELTIEVPEPQEQYAAQTPTPWEIGVEQLLAAAAEPTTPAVEPSATFDEVLDSIVQLAHTTEPVRPTHADLARLGVPKQFMPAHDPTTLAETTRLFPPGPDLGSITDELVVVIGPEGPTTAVAGHIGGALGTRPRWLRVTDTGVNRDPSRTLGGRREGRPRVVGIVTASDDAGVYDRAAHIGATLSPDATWVAVDARTRTGQLRTYTQAVTAHTTVDAIGAEHVALAQQPAAVLGLGIPVGLVDGTPATPLLWGALLGQHLIEDAT